MIRQPDSTFKEPRLLGAKDRLVHRPALQAAEELIERARQHPLGTGFLQAGALDSVAATFGVHAFTVDRARDLLGDR